MQFGSEEHKNLFCRFFIYSHRVFKASDLSWPELTPEEIEMLASLPFWDMALATENLVQHKLQAYAEQEVTDPLLREAIALQAYEEGRHADILKSFLDYYRIPYREPEAPTLPENLEWGFLRTGAGECIDAFFGFGFLQLARAGSTFPAALVESFAPVLEEEARHLIFYQNWLFYERYRRPGLVYPVWHFLKTAAALLAAASERVRGFAGENRAFSVQALRQRNLAGSGLRSFLESCLRENKRLLAPYDRRLVRPKLVPTVAGFLRYFF